MKIIASITQELPEDSSDSDEEEESEDDNSEGGNPGAKRAASATTRLGPDTGMASPAQGVQAPFSQQQARRTFPLPVNPMAQSLFLSGTSRLPHSLLQPHQLRQSSSMGHGNSYDLLSSQLHNSRQNTSLLQQPMFQASPIYGSPSLLGQSLLPSSNSLIGNAQQNNVLNNPLMPSSLSGFSSDFACAAVLRAAQMQQQQQQQQGSAAALSAYLHALRSTEEGQESSPQDQLVMQARLMGAPNPQHDDILVQLAEQYLQGDPGVRQYPASTQTQQPQQQASLLSQQQQQQQQSSLLPQQQLLLNATLERQQVNSQIQALLQQIQRRQEGPTDGSFPPTRGV